ncbi:MAG: alpha amylase C-terminal domain-containing protein, partial [Firmicutes bacterium]|nr:alpha amylase C-terminal domain-containing protein [Candidatus Caballimonas caccae]
NVYKTNPALFEIEDSWDGFNWITADERDNNIFAFTRKDKEGNQIAVIVNFSGNDYYKYRLGLDKGTYKIILCSDDIKFGGSGIQKKKTISTNKKIAHNREDSVMLNIAKFSGIYLLKAEG